MSRLQKALCSAGCVLALFGTLGGCGSSESSTRFPPAGGGTPPPEVIQGVATPPSVAVVTATNAT